MPGLVAIIASSLDTVCKTPYGPLPQMTSDPPSAAADLQPGGADGQADTELRSEIIARRIREAVVAGELAPGERIRQDTFARELGTSRIPVREALRQLESEGLVTLVPHAGARVAQVDGRELQEMYRIREAIEPMLIAESAQHISDEQLAGLREILHEIEASEGEPERWLDADRRFHLAAYEGADMPTAREMVNGFWNRTQHYRRALIVSLPPDRFEIINLEHRLILDALERHSGEGAAAALRTHIGRTRETLLQRSAGSGS